LSNGNPKFLSSKTILVDGLDPQYLQAKVQMKLLHIFVKGILNLSQYFNLKLHNEILAHGVYFFWVDTLLRIEIEISTNINLYN
jgi:hypothetical protein